MELGETVKGIACHDAMMRESLPTPQPFVAATTARGGGAHASERRAHARTGRVA